MVGESGTDAQFKSGSYVSGTNRVWPSLLKFLELVSTVDEKSLKTIAMSQSNGYSAVVVWSMSTSTEVVHLLARLNE